MAIFASVKAVGTVTRAATTDLLADGDTITIGAITYRFKTTTAQANDIFLGGSSSTFTIAAFNSLAKVLNGTATIAASGADAYTATVNGHAAVKAGTMTSLTQLFTARMPGVAGNQIAFSESITDAEVTLNGSGFLGATTAGSGSAASDLTTWISGMQSAMQFNGQLEVEFEKLAAELA